MWIITLAIIVWFLNSHNDKKDKGTFADESHTTAASTADSSTKTVEYPEGTYTIKLEPNEKFVSVDCSGGELHIVTKPKTGDYSAPVTYNYTGYEAGGGFKKIARYTIIEN